MQEDTGLPYASEVAGTMHACGHDAHVAMLVAAAHLLAGHRSELAGRAVLMFQPGEEGYGGAKFMLEEGLLEDYGRVDRAFALHISPSFAAGSMFTRPGPIMASSDHFVVKLTGRGGHASQPHEATDPIPAACEIVTALQVMVTRRVPAFDPAVVTVARVTAGSTSNVIPETAVLEGTVRAVSEATRRLVLDGLRAVVDHVAAAHSCTTEITAEAMSYPVVVNDGEAAEQALAVASTLFGPAHANRMPSPIMGAEDWAFVLEQVPGCLAFLGAAPPGQGTPAPNHSNRMVLDEEAMAAGIAMHAAMALAPA